MALVWSNGVRLGHKQMNKEGKGGGKGRIKAGGTS